MTIPQQAVIDDKGHIHIHGRSGARIDLSFTNAAGAPLDVSASTFAFECAPLNLGLDAGASNDKRVLNISKANLDQIGLRSVAFVLLDKTTSPHASLWSGLLRVYGFL